MHIVAPTGWRSRPIRNRKTPATASAVGSRPPNRIVCLYLTCNILGVLLYLHFASLIWAPPAEKGLYGGPGDPIIWVVFALPFLMFFSLLNFFIFMSVFVRAILYKRWFFCLMVVGVIFGWFTAFRYDNSRQFDGSWVRTDMPPRISSGKK